MKNIQKWSYKTWCIEGQCDNDIGN